MNYLIDTDPGVDDALAIMYAVLAGLSVRGLVTVFGNVNVDQATTNALTVLELLQSNISVAKGASHALRHIHCVAESHGLNGLSGFSLSELSRKTDPRDGVEFMRDVLLKEGKASFICIGPTTNLASLCRLYPDASALLGDVIILGGSFEGKGNTTDYAEFNVFSDPQALHDVLASGCKPVIIPQEICQFLVCSRKDFEQLGTGPLAENIRTIVEAYITYYEHETRDVFEGGVMYDVLAVAYALMPSAFELEEVHIDVNTNNDEFRGQTTVTPGTPNARLVKKIDAHAIRTSFLGQLQAATKHSAVEPHQ